MSEVQAVGRGVGTDIEGQTAGVKLVDKVLGGNILNKTPPFEFFI